MKPIEPLETRRLLNAGDLVTDFAANGLFVSGFGSHAIFHDVEVQSDGRIVAVGAVGADSPSPKVLIARFTSDGKLDKSFSGDGFSVTTLSGHGTAAYGMLLAGDGKIVICGAGPNDSGFIARYTSDGRLDTSFSSDGIAFLKGGPFFEAALAGSKIVAVSPKRVARFRSAGSLDSNFGSAGQATFSFSDNPDFMAGEIAVLPNGKLIVGGQTSDGDIRDVVILRLGAEGSLDTTFGNAGRSVESADDADNCLALQIRSNGDIVFGMGAEGGENFLGEIPAEGDPQSSIESPGTITRRFPSFDDDLGGFLTDFIERSDGSIIAVASGHIIPDTESYLSVLRMTSSGSPDPGFSVDGRAGPTFLGSPVAIALTPQGDIIVAGSTTADGSGLALLAKFDNGSSYNPVNLYDDGELIVSGTSADDTIRLAESLGQLTVTLNGRSSQFDSALVQSIQIDAGGGSYNVVTIGPNIRGALIQAGDGSDTITAGDGNDTIRSGAGSDRVFAGAGNDQIEAGLEARFYDVQTLYGGAGDDTIFAGDGPNRIYGGDGDDSILGGPKRDTIYGEAGRDTIRGGAGNDLIDGGSGNDRLYGNGGLDTLFGQGGNDRFYTIDGGMDELFGGSGADSADSDFIDLKNSIELVI